MPRKKKTDKNADVEAGSIVKELEEAGKTAMGVVGKVEENIKEDTKEIAEAVEDSAKKKKTAKTREDKMQTIEELRKKIGDTAKQKAEKSEKEKTNDSIKEDIIDIILEKNKREGDENTETIKDAEKSKSGRKDEFEKPKKKEIKLLSEKELKKIMTDTKETLVPLTDYIKCSVHLGTKVITPDMRKYVYKRRADGLAVINTNLIDDKLREAVAFLNKFESKDIFIACKREAGWQAVGKFSEVTGIRAFTKKYPAGIITNLDLDDFFEVKMVVICDPWIDKNALSDSIRLDLPVIGICDTNNYTKGVTNMIIGNNKSGKSIGLILYVLSREYLKSKGKNKEAKELKIEDFTGKLEEIEIRSG